MSEQPQLSKGPSNQKSDFSLKLYNSLTKQKDEFIPKDGNKVLWYSCGPTVYDASHMGHARSYISFDILRRVLSDYFKYDVFYVMNITDIDDKIIKRARQNYLYDEYINNNQSLEKILADIKLVINTFKDTVEKITDPDKKSMFLIMLHKIRDAVQDLQRAVNANNPAEIKELQNTLLRESKDLLSDWLDKNKGSSVTEHSIFSQLSTYWENEFLSDMDNLNVLRPSVLTRVSEYVPQIVSFIEKIIPNGMAYENNGSVYFDVKAFDNKEKHKYAKLVPEAYGNMSSLREGEGDLSISAERLSEKRSPTDFALWKNSKPGEPWWDSPWGKGRPGWHIECSVMASATCGDHLDIHTGGVDLKFPHHDNELAQSEAYWDKSNWVNYFLHSGHLTISGCKMSKSLKNFVSVKEALKKNTARQLRLAFLLHSWKDTLNYSDATMDMAVRYEKFLNEFFLNVECRTRKIDADGSNIHNLDELADKDLDMKNKFDKAKDDIHEALCDNVDTKSVLEIIRKLVSNSNIYLKDCPNPNVLLLRDISDYIQNIMKIFGVISAQDSQNIGETVKTYLDILTDFCEKITAIAKKMEATEILQECDNLQGNILSNVAEETVMVYLEILAEFRDKVRIIAKKLKTIEILKVCDDLRDEVLPNVGVRLEDEAGAGSRVKLVNKEELLKEREEKKRIQIEKAAMKEKKKAEAAAAKEAKRQKNQNVSAKETKLILNISK